MNNFLLRSVVFAFFTLSFSGFAATQGRKVGQTHEQSLRAQIKVEKDASRRFDLQKALLKEMKSQSQAKKNFAVYENEIRRTLDSKSFSSHQEEVRKLYTLLTEAEYQKALQKRASKSQRTSVIALIGRFDKKVLVADEQAEQRALWSLRKGVLLQMNSDHLAALKIFSNLLTQHEDRKANSFGAKVLNHALISAHVRSEWPTTITFQAVARKNVADRKALRSLYEMKLLADSRPEKAWPALAQMGLLSINLGETSEAVNRWQDYLYSNPSRNNISAEISGFLLREHELKKDWKSLEKLSTFLLKKGYAARFAKTNTVIEDKLALSLWNLSLEARNAQDFTAAVGHLTRFIELAKSKKSGLALSKIEDARYSLAQVKKAKGDHDGASEQLKILASEFPRGRYAAECHSLMGNWALERGHEDEALRSFDTVREHFSDSKYSIDARKKLSRMYFSRGFTDVAVAVDRELALDKRLAKAERSEHANAALDKIQIDGSAREIQSLVSFVNSLGFTSDETKSNLASAEIAALVQKENVSRAEYKALRAKVEGMVLMDQSTRDSLAKLVFENTIRRSENKREEIYAATLTNPAKVLDEEWQYYLGLKQGYSDVCDLGASLYCAPALLGRATLAEQFQERLNRVSIAETLAKETVDSFNNRKSNMVASLKKEVEESRQNAAITVAKMHTQPVWVQAVLWETSADWNFDRLTEEMKNSMLQTRAKDYFGNQAADGEMIGKLD